MEFYRLRGTATRNWIGRVLLVALGTGAGWMLARQTEALGSTGAPGGWQTAVVERRDIGATVLATGEIRPQVGAQVAVGSRASGVVGRLHVTIGDRVRAGQLLAELDPVEYRTQVARAEAQLLSATAERAYADEQFARARSLAAADVVTPAELSAAQRSLDTARAREREAAAALEAARVQLGYTRITAPITGVIASVSTQEGETVAASFSAPTFVTIIDLARLEVWAYVDETDIGRIEVGQRARFTVDTYPGEHFDGRVTAVRPGAEVRDNVVNYITLIEFDNPPDRLLRPEMTTTVNIVLDGRTGALAVPNGALRRDDAGTYVLVPARDGVERRDIDVGFRGAAYTEVLDGVVEGDHVVLGPAQPCGPDPTAQRHS
jgi:RND family efflux transporter MFP subunit